MTKVDQATRHTQAPVSTQPSGELPGWVKPVAIGGGILAGIGGIALALRSSSTPLRLLGAGVAAIAGASLLAGCSTSSGAAKGSTPDAVTDAIIGAYDHSGNGTIELRSRSGLPSDDERLRIETRDRSKTTTDWDPNDEDFLPWGNPYGDSHTERWDERRLVSGAAIFEAANEDGDDVVTREELLDLITQYDDFQDGKIGRSELDAYNSDNPEQYDDWVRTG